MKKAPYCYKISTQILKVLFHYLALFKYVITKRVFENSQLCTSYSEG